VRSGWWAVLLTLPALAPLARPGFFESHDGLFHVYRLAALDQAVRVGVLYPRWFPEFAFGYGHPVLNFYGPLSYYWGLPFTLVGLSPFVAMKLVLASGLVASALGMLLFARLHLDRGPALVAAVVYAYLPYHLVDLYVRGAVAEFLAFVWFPLVLWAFHCLVENPKRPSLPSVARVGLASILLAALVVTHNLSALIFSPVLAAYVLILWLRRRGSGAPSARAVISALALTLTLSSFYWLPVLAESRYVGLGHGASQGYRDHLLPLARLISLSLAYPYPAEQDVVPTFPLGLVQLGIAAAALASLVPVQDMHRERRPKASSVLAPLRPGAERRLKERQVQAGRPPSRGWLPAFFLAVVLLSAFMLTTASLPVWKLFEKGLAFLQYPWRFQALTTLGTAVLAGALVDGQARPTRPIWRALAGLVILVTGLWALGRLPFTLSTPVQSVEAMWQTDRDTGQVGATWTGEYLPIWVKEQRWAVSLPATGSGASNTQLSPGELQLTGVGYTRYDFTVPALPAGAPVDAPLTGEVILHQFYYPGWEARWQGAASPASPQGVLGLASFDLLPGNGPLSLRLGLTWAQLLGTLLSLASFLAMGVALIAQLQLRSSELGRCPSRRAQIALLALAVCCLLLTAILLASVALPNGYVRAVRNVGANLEDTVELLAYTTDRTSYRPGETVNVALYWRALRAPDQDYKAFVHLTDAALRPEGVLPAGSPPPGKRPAHRKGSGLPSAQAQGTPQRAGTGYSAGTRQPAQHDGDPGAGSTPTTRWLPGEVVPDTHPLLLPADLPPGRYLLWAGMYEYGAVRNLTVLSSDVAAADNRVLLGEIEVVSP